MENYSDISAFFSELRLKKARALAMFLLLEPGRDRRNSLVMDLFWQQTEEKKAQASLRQTIRHLREVSTQSLAFPIKTGGGIVSADLPRDWSMLETIASVFKTPTGFEKASGEATAFLDDLDILVGISDTFDGWINVMRDQALATFRDALEQIIAGAQGAHGQSAAEFLSHLDPFCETAARFLMQHHWKQGAPTRAVEVYNKLYTALDEALDQEPEMATIELLAAIKLRPDEGKQSKQNTLALQKITMAVEEIANPDLSKQNASFQSVLVGDLRSRLSRFREWQVIDKEPMRNDFLAIRVKLITTDSQSYLLVEVVRPGRRELLWSEIIDDPHKDWVDKVRMLVVNIGNALRVVVADRQHRDVRAQLYDRWLQSLALKGTWTQEDEIKAIALLRGITQEAPEFGPAHAELAGIYNIRHVLRPGTFQEDGLKDIALSHALEAVAADAMDTRAHRVLAWCYCHKSEFDLAEFHFDQSLVLNAQNTHTIASCALGFAFCDNLPSTRDMIEKMARLPEAMEPFHQIYLAAAHYLVGNFDKCAKHCDAGDGMMSTVGGWHTAALAKMGDLEGARQRLERYQREIAQIWRGNEQPDTQNIINWYVSCFPLRNDAVREDLRATLRVAMAAQSTLT